MQSSTDDYNLIFFSYFALCKAGLGEENRSDKPHRRSEMRYSGQMNGFGMPCAFDPAGGAIELLFITQSVITRDTLT